MATRLTEEQVREVLARAEQIQQRLQAEGASTTRVDDVIRAAEEVGLSRDAVELALAEHLNTHGEPAKAGERVFALSTDGKYYVADVIEATESSARVKFIRGGERTLAHSDLRPFALVPGQRVVCPWQNWGDWTCTVVSYHEDSQKVCVYDGWSTEKMFGIDQIHLDPPRPANASSVAFGRLALFLSGGVVGAIVTWLVTR